MILKKAVALSLLFIPLVFGTNASINAGDNLNSSNIGLVEIENEYRVYAQESEVGYLHVTVID